jgi:membrane associated rhomboid family serine protease
VRDLERVRYVTENYERLQGLKVVPGGVVLLLFAGLTFLRFDLPGMTAREEGALFGVLFLLGGISGILVATVVGWVIGQRYERRYGKVRRSPPGRRTVFLLALGTVAFWMAYILDTALRPPVYLPWLVIGAAGLVFWWPERRFRAHYLVAAAAFVVVGLLPLVGVLPRGFASEPGLLLALGGVCAVAVGVLDHLLLVGTMRRLPEEDGRAV